MKEVTSQIIVFVGLVLGAGCAGIDGMPSLCGDSEAATILTTVQVVDGEQSAIPNAKVICHLQMDGLLGTTNEIGLAEIKVSGIKTEICGFFPECEIMYVRLPDGSTSRPL